jgi:hypothetical protein
MTVAIVAPNSQVVPQQRMIVRISDPVKLNIPTYEGSGQGVEPGVIRIPGGFGPDGDEYWMVFAPYPNSNALYENVSVLSSKDGINWHVPTGATNPILTPPNGIYYYDPTIVWEYYAGNYNRIAVYYTDSTANNTYRTVSNDGVHWSAPVQTSVARWEQTGGATGTLAAPMVNYIGQGQWEAFTLLPSGGQYGWGSIERAISSDGVNWTQITPPQPSNLIGLVQGELNGFRDATGYHIVVPAWGTQYKNIAGSELYYGFSPTGDQFYFDPVPIVGQKPGTWYSNYVYRGSIIAMGNNVYRVYFSAMDKNSVWSIGYVDCLINSAYLPKRSQRVVYNLWYRTALRSTTELITSNPNYLSWIWKYKNKIIHVSNNLDQPINMRLVAQKPGVNSTTWYVDGTAQSISGISNQYATTITSASLSGLGIQSVGYPIQVRASASTAPTAGDLSIWIEAWDDDHYH